MPRYSAGMLCRAAIFSNSHLIELIRKEHIYLLIYQLANEMIISESILVPRKLIWATVLFFDCFKNFYIYSKTCSRSSIRWSTIFPTDIKLGEFVKMASPWCALIGNSDNHIWTMDTTEFKPSGEVGTNLT